MTENKYNEKLNKIKQRNNNIKQKQKLKKEKRKYKNSFKIPTSKLVLLGVVLLCVEIVLFCEYVMLKSNDTSALYALIGVPATLVPTCLGYFHKSKAENTEGGIVYDTAMAELFNNGLTEECED